MGITALFNNCHPDILPNMKLFKILFLVSNVATAPGNYFSLRSNPTSPQTYFTRKSFAASPQTYFTRKSFAASPQTYFTRKSFAAPQTYFTRTRFPPAPQTYSSRIDIDSNVYKVEKENYVTDNRVKVDVSSKSPSTAAALAYVNSVVKDTKKEEHVRRLKERGEMLVLMERRIMSLRLLWLLSRSGQELRMVILAQLLELTMLKRYLLVNHILVLLLLQ